MIRSLLTTAIILSTLISFAQNTYVPDDNFEQTLVDLGYDSGELNDYVPTASIDTLKFITLSEKDISDLSGIQDFEALKYLNCSYNTISTLNLNIDSLIMLFCNLNHLTNLNISTCTSLGYLYCSRNQLRDIDISQNVNLIDLDCYDNLLTTIDISQNVNLIDLDCYDNLLTTIDLSNNNILSSLSCQNNQLTSLDISNNDSLTSIYCHNNQLTFESIEPIMEHSLEYFTYSPQAKIGEEQSVSESVGRDYSYELIVGGTYNQYQWLKDGIELPNQTSSLLNLTMLTTSDAGIYTCEVTNTLCTKLTLYSREITLTINPSSTERTYVPDDNFEQALIDLGYDYGELDDYVPTENIINIDTLRLYNLGIANLRGIEDFTSLIDLYCAQNLFTTLDVSLNTKLTRLSCSDNKLTNLDISNNTELTNLNCDQNKLTNLDISNNSNLLTLSCYDNFITSLDISQNIKLFYLSCNNNKLTSLDVSSTTELEHLQCSENLLTSIDVSRNTQLTSLLVTNNYLSSLDISENIELFLLRCSNNNISSIDFTNNINLDWIYCSSNRLTFESLETPTPGSHLYCSPQDSVGIKQSFTKNEGENFTYEMAVGGTYNQYQWYKAGGKLPDQTTSTLNLTNLSNYDAAIYTCEVTNTQVTSLSLYSREVTLSLNNQGSTFVPDNNFEQALIDLGLDSGPLDNYVPTANIREVTNLDLNSKNIYNLIGIEDFTSLDSLNCRSTQISYLDLSNNLNLSYLDCAFSLIRDINVSNNSKLEYLNCFNNQLTHLNIENSPDLLYLSCAYNKLQELDLSNDSRLSYLNCYTNQIQELAVDNLTELKSLICSNNQIEELTVNNLVKLESLSCSNNQIEELTVNNLVKLESLSCSNNQLEELIVNNLVELTSLSCSDNQLTDIDISNNDKLNNLQCSFNLLTSLNTSNTTNLISLYCIQNQLTSLAINDKLETLNCNNNRLENLNLDQNLNLIDLDCAYNQLTSLDVSRNVNLTNIDCSYNQLGSLTVNPTNKLYFLNCTSNKLSFEDLEPAANIELFFYSHQDSIGTTFAVTKAPGQSYSYELVVGGANNQYQWVKVNDSFYYQNINTSTLNLPYLAISSSGVYSCEVTNTLCPDLTLYSREITLTVSDTPGDTYIPDDNFEQALIDLGYDSGELNNYVPTSNIMDIISLDVSNTSISDLTGIEDFTSLTSFSCDENQLSFRDIESVYSLPNFSNFSSAFNYSPQNQVGEGHTLERSVDESITLTIDNYEAGEHDQYQWYKNEILIEEATTISLELSNLTTDDGGDYQCMITNTIATDLILESKLSSISIQGMGSGVPISEYDALANFYNSLNGDNWLMNDNWMDTTYHSVNDWLGITVNNGHVTEIYFGPYENYNLNGSIPNSIGDLTELQSLVIVTDNVSGELPPRLFELTNLKNLYIAECNLSGTIPSEIRNLVNLERLGLGANNLSGTIPPEIGNLVNLERLILEENNLEGSIPEEIGDLIRVTGLSLQKNNLSGEIPSIIGNLTSLEFLGLSYNNLSGTIPETIGNLSNLKWLLLDNNQIVGPLPEQLADLENLIKIDINNNLIGWISNVKSSTLSIKSTAIENRQIPDELSGLLQMDTLRLAGNSLQFNDLEAIFSWNNLAILMTLFIPHKNILVLIKR